MRQRGRKSAAELAIIRANRVRPRAIPSPPSPVPPPPPVGLGEAEKQIWRDVLSEYRSSLTSLHLLESGLEAHARAREANEIIAAEGLTVPGRDGPKANPLCKVEHDARRQFQTTFRLLGIKL